MTSPPHAPSSRHPPIRGPERVSVVLDTAVLIAAERRAFEMPGSLAALGDAPVAVAANVASEILHDIEWARDAAIRKRRSDFAEGVLTNVLVFPFILAEARAHARVCAELAKAGAPISAHDLQIGAPALVAGSEVGTLDVSAFRRMSGLPLAELARLVRT